MENNQQLETMAKRVLDEIGKCASMPEIEEIRIKTLGKKGELTAALRSMKDIPNEQRPAFGKRCQRDQRYSDRGRLIKRSKKSNRRVKKSGLKRKPSM